MQPPFCGSEVWKCQSLDSLFLQPLFTPTIASIGVFLPFFLRIDVCLMQISAKLLGAGKNIQQCIPR